MKPAWISVIGSSGSGKTTLLTELIPHLRTKGLRVAAVKHSGDAHALHKPGSDTERLEEAGAAPVVFATSKGAQLTFSGDPGLLLPAILERFASAVDLILVEGWRSSTFPKIEVWRKEIGPMLSSERADVLAIVTNDEAPSSVCTFQRENVSGLADFLVQWIRDPAGLGGPLPAEIHSLSRRG